MSDAYAEREQEFADADEGMDPGVIYELIHDWVVFSDRIFMNEAAIVAAMVSIYEVISGKPAERDVEAWPDLWISEEGVFTELRLTQLFTALSGYAFFGLWPDAEHFGIEAENDIGRIGGVVGEARQFRDSLPENWQQLEGFDDILLAAEARFALDTDASLTPEQLAALAEVGVRTVKNLLMPSSAHPLRTTEDGRIPAGDALGWLRKRENFRTSIWHERSEARPRRSGDEETDLGDEEILFVPVARDGSIFEPESCRRNGFYVIGARGAEQRFEDFREALEALTQMPVPRWRRPNDRGKWGSVRADGDRWLRRTASELGLVPSTPTH